jgi:hypothetical protein
MRVYCDTDTLFHNIEKHADQAKARAELDALRFLLKQHGEGHVTMYRSRVNLRELERTPNVDQLRLLQGDYEALEPIPLDERHYGNTEEVADLRGSVISSPLVSDVQDEKILAELQGYGIRRRDAEHVTVRDVKTDHDTFLNYATQDMLAFVMFFSQPRTPAGDSEMQTMTRELVDAVLEAGGRYYLPYRLHPTAAQFRRAYPQADEFFNLKKHYDPQELFQNEFYRKYGTQSVEQPIQR